MKHFYLFMPLHVMAFFSLFLFSADVNAQVQTARSISMVANSNAFYEYLPQGYNSESQTYPLLVFIHGVGELGNGSASSLPTVLRNGPPKYINEGSFPVSFTVNGQAYKFIVISPQFINWPASSDVQGVIDYAVSHYRVNTNKIYLTGLSMGGGATWDFAGYSANYANRLAAIVPVCGASGPETSRIKIMAAANLPIWATHCQDDGTVPVSNTIAYVDNFNASTPTPNPTARKTIFPTGGHDAWSQTYIPSFRENNLNVYEWMLQYQRGSSVTTPRAVPGKVEAENYSAMSGILTETTADAGGGMDVGWIESGDWLDYEVNVASSGTYTLNTRVASPYASQQFQVKKSDGTVLATVNVPQTGNFQSWTTVSTAIALQAGVQTLRIYSVQSGWNINWIDFIAPVASKAVPGKIEAESYNAMSGILTENTADAGGGLDVGWIESGDWLDYNVNVAYTGSFTLNARVASPYASQQFQVKKPDGTVLATVNVPQTGNFQNWTTVSTIIALQAGVQTLRIYSVQSGWNINWIDFTTSSGGQAVPGKIEAESFNAMSGILTENTSDAGGGLDVGWIESGDWLEYNVNVASTGTYTFNARVATPYSSQQFQVRKSDGSVLATINVPQTGNFQSWSTVSTTLALQAGSQAIRIYSVRGGWNINWMEFTAPFVGQSIPGKIEAESYNAMSGIQTENTSDAGGGLDVGWMDSGDWLDYNVNVSSAGTYTLNARVATPYASQQFQVRKSDGNVLATINVPQTGNFQTWSTVSTSLALQAGSQAIRIYSVRGGWNINWMEFTSGSAVASLGTIDQKVADIIQDQSSGFIYPNPVSEQFALQVANRFMGKFSVQIVDQSGKIVKTLQFSKNQPVTVVTIPVNNLPAGGYYVKIQMTGWTDSKKFIKK